MHDYLTQRGGAERVVLAMVKGLGTGRIGTSLYEPDSCFPDFRLLDVRTSPLQRVRFLRRHHRWALPLYAPIFALTRVDADVVVCSTSGWAHGVQASGRKVVYVENTARWLYQGDEYLAQLPHALRVSIRPLLGLLRRWDRRAASGADAVIANSVATRERIRRNWGRDAHIVPPPHSINPVGGQRSVAGLDPGFLLVVARLMSYKRVDAVLGAMRHLEGRRLVVVGDGPDYARLKGLAPAETTFLRGCGDDQLRWLYANCSAVVAAAIEDFGLVPLEAMAFAKPVVARRIGGYLETVVEGETGVFFDEPEPEIIAEAVRLMESTIWDEKIIAKRAAEFSESTFVARIQAIIAEAESQPSQSSYRRTLAAPWGQRRASGAARSRTWSAI